MNEELLPIICCPQSRQPLSLLDGDGLVRLNRRIAQGEIRNAAGETVTLPLEKALVREDGRIAYPVRDSIPLLVVEEGIPL